MEQNTIESIKLFGKKFNIVSESDQHTPFLGLPFMPTYTHPWTDKDLYEYFNLTPEEIAIIESEIQ